MENKKPRLVAFTWLTALLILVIVIAVVLKTSWIFFTVLGVAAVLTFFIVIWFHWFVIQQDKLSKEEGISDFEKGSGSPLKFRYEELMLATDDFSLIVGQGGSGCVFKGMLKDGTCIAVKRIEGQGRGEREFRTEVASIGCVQHVNLVRLYGYCIVPNGLRYLVYEFVQNGSLDRWIFPRENQQPRGCLSWKLRLQVAIDVAKALAYLHNNVQSRILHLDVKPENILLDDKYRALVSDFGLAKLMGKEDSMVVSRIRGTRGYLAPEWILEKGISAKTDVYSYGMLLLEMIGGRRNVLMSPDNISKGKSTMLDVNTWEYFPKTVSEKVKTGKLMEVVDRRLLEEGTVIDENEVRKLVYIALWCIQERGKIRPTMGQVVNMLEGRLSVDQPPETDMFVHDLLSIKTEKTQGWTKIKATALQIYKSPYNKTPPADSLLQDHQCKTEN